MKVNGGVKKGPRISKDTELKNRVKTQFSSFIHANDVVHLSYSSRLFKSISFILHSPANSCPRRLSSPIFSTEPQSHSVPPKKIDQITRAWSYSISTDSFWILLQSSVVHLTEHWRIEPERKRSDLRSVSISTFFLNVVSALIHLRFRVRSLNTAATNF